MNCLIFCFTCALVAVTVTAQPAVDCWELRNRDGFTECGVYEIHPSRGPSASVQVRCDMETDGGGWTVLQRRFDGSLNFDRNMTEYEQGFGDVAGEHWLGLEWIHVLTSHVANPVEVRFDVCSFDGTAGHTVYEDFYISTTYLLHAGNYIYEGSLWDKLSNHDGRPFLTTGTCADKYKGGWWYADCLPVNLNGGTYDGEDTHGIVWRNFGVEGLGWPSLRSSEIKIRPLGSTGDPSSTYTCAA